MAFTWWGWVQLISGITIGVWLVFASRLYSMRLLVGQSEIAQKENTDLLTQINNVLAQIKERLDSLDLDADELQEVIEIQKEQHCRQKEILNCHHELSDHIRQIYDLMQLNWPDADHAWEQAEAKARWQKRLNHIDQILESDGKSYGSQTEGDESQ